ncbi:MAG TPA: glycoside hydrolase family 9 protein [Actinomycetota bacterium]|nr:glycoside hydrolase family 9 protein [Actinomycetota bacterium]
MPPAVPTGQAAARSAAVAFVRVDQVGYPLAAPKRAYLMSSDRETGAAFQVRDGQGRIVYAGHAGPSLGAWSDAFPFVYPIDFDAVTTPGTYRIVVTAPVRASSPRFPIEVGTTIARGALANALAFYQVQRDGPQFVRSPLRSSPAHLHDRRAMTYRTPVADADGVFRGDLRPLGVRIDAAGGWWDAGDYLKFVHTTSYTVALMLAGIRDFPDLLGSGSATSNFTSEAKFGLRWLLRMWDDRRQVLYYQVGIGSGNARTVGDHDLWRLPQADDAFGGRDPRYRYIRHRPVFRAGPPGAPVSPNLAGRDAAAFALCFQVFRERDPSFADRCLLAAEHVFDLADTSPAGRLVTAIPWDFYPEVEWRDDLELGATELSLALSSGGLPPGLPHADPLFYLRAGAHWAREYVSGPNDAADTLNLYDVSGLAHYELVQAIARAGDPAGLEIDRAGLLADLKKQLDAAVAVSRRDPFGFGYPWNRWDTTTHGTGLSVMASEYDELTGTATYAAYSAGWLGNVLGANAWGVSLIVGDGTTFPHCLQHQVANLAGALDGSAPVLLGAAVEGPNHFAAHGHLESMRRCPPGGGDRFARFNGRAVFKDDVESYSTVEPAIDLTASSLLAFARQASGLV